VSIERGHDPSRFTAVPFGGGGALHAGALIRDVGLKAALVPRFPGITSALGCIIADIRNDHVVTVNVMLDGLDSIALDRRMVDAGRAARRVVETSGLFVERIDVAYELDMHYLGQTHTVAVPLPVTLDSREQTTGVSEPIVRAAFEAAYAQAFSRLLTGTPVRIVNLRVAAIGRRPAFDMRALLGTEEGGGERKSEPAGHRPVWFDNAWHETAIYDRLSVPIGTQISGPAIFEQPDATTVVDPGLGARVDAYGNLIVERQA
jgi:N-methylhydantoinase A